LFYIAHNATGDQQDHSDIHDT